VSDYIIDTNVLLVASAVHPYSPFADSHVPLKQQQTVFEWLSAFRTDPQHRLVMDDVFRIYQEYRNRLSDQDFGLLAVHDKLQSFRSVALTWDADGEAEVPAALQACDRSDRKFLAAALSDPTTISLVNATDSDWIEIEQEVAAAGVQVVHLIETWLRGSMEHS
jgi:hypothetical protein